MATLQEIETHWSIADLADMNLILDQREEAEENYRKELETKHRRRAS